MSRPFPAQPDNSRRFQPFAVWRRRLLLAVMLLFGSEVLLWTDPIGRPIADWIPLFAGYLCLAALLIDLAARFRVRNIFGLLALAGIYGLLGSLLLNPDTTLTDMPRTLFTRVLGAHTFAGVLMLLLFLRLVTPGRMSLLAGVVAGGIAGFGWGTWARWSPMLLRADAADTPLTTMLAVAAVSGIVTIILLLFRRENGLLSISMRLQPHEWVVVLLTLAGLLLARVLSSQIDSLSLVLVGTLVVFCVIVLWFLRREKGQTLLERAGTDAPPWRLFVALLAGFILLSIIGYDLPRGEGSQDPMFLITVLLTGFGLAWLPGVSLALGAQAVSRQVRAGKL